MNDQPRSDSDNSSEPAVFDTEKYYVIAQNLFDHSDVRFLYELRNLGTPTEKDSARRANLIGKGYSINLCRYIDLITDEGQEECDLIYKKDEQSFGFKINRVLEFYPLIEGNFIAGIYTSINGDRHYEVKDEVALSNLYSCTVEIGLDYDEYKLVCTSNGVEIVEIENGEESILCRLPHYPFTYFDLICPICRRGIWDYLPKRSDSNYCELIEARCEHYVGQVEKERGKYIIESLDALKTPYKFEDEDLLLMTSDGWRKPIIYTPRLYSNQSYWGTSEGEEYQNIFLFLKAETPF